MTGMKRTPSGVVTPADAEPIGAFSNTSSVSNTALALARCTVDRLR